MTYLWWTLTISLMLFGLVGTLVPILPGTTIILAAAIIHHLTLPQRAMTWSGIIGLLVLTVISYIVEFMSGTWGARWFGATRWGAIGGVIGGIVGMFFGIIGILVAPLAGVLIGELLGGKELVPAAKSTWGSLLGTTAGMVAKLAIGLVMVVWFAIAVWPR